MQVSAQMEDYLEAIGNFCNTRGFARVKEISSNLKVSTASVVSAIKNLKKLGLVKQEYYGYITLTPKGELISNSVINRHKILANFLENVLGLDKKLASIDACKIEHAVGDETLERLRAVALFIEEEVHRDLKWKKEFGKFYKKYKSQKVL